MKLSHPQRLVLASILGGASLIAYNFNPTFIADSLMILASLIAAWPIFLRALNSLKYKIVSIDALVTLAVVGATLIGEYWEVAAVAILFLLGEYLESKALEKTRSAIKSLVDMTPTTARVTRQGEEKLISPLEVSIGETVTVKPGEKVPVDGEVIEGLAYINQASITGEPVPIEAKPKSSVYSGTILESGYVKIKTTKTGQDTTFSRILQLVEEAQDKKAKTQSFLEKFSRKYTPAIILLSALTLLLTKDVYLALTLLVIACPGALVIAVPVSIVAGIGSAARRGVLIKGGESVENTAKIKAVAFDKTGTLTIGKPEVTTIKPFTGNKEELLKLAASAEQLSEHPLASAIIKAAQQKSIKLLKPSSSQIIVGQGIKAKVGQHQILVGNQTLLKSHDVSISPAATKHLKAEQSQGRTAVLVASEGILTGVISIADKLRPEARQTIKLLHQRGIKTYMLTGDNLRAARSISKQLGITNIHADLLPEDKVETLKQIIKQHPNSVAMIGDGVNDTPALATANIGIAVGGPGKDIAMETADVVLLSGNLSRLTDALDISKATAKNMKQNIYFAVLVVTSLIVGVLTEIVFLSSGMLLHVLSVLLVIINALRLLRYNSK